MPNKSSSDVTHLIFDVESVADGALVSKVRYSDVDISDNEAIETYQDELMELHGTTFIPHTFQIPTAVVIAKVAADGSLVDLVSLDEPQFRPHVMASHFWKGWERYDHPTWVTFNGRGFDLPLMELAAFRYGISLKKWFSGGGYSARRNRYNKESHLDLQDVLTNYGAARCHGGLHLVANLIAKPGKLGMRGDQVQEQFNRGNLMAISNYCRCDVLDTYFVFLRMRTVMGDWDVKHENKLVCQAKEFLEKRVDENEAYQDYLGHWGDWMDPWCDD